MGDEEVEEFVDCDVIAREVDVHIKCAFVSGAGRVNAGDVGVSMRTGGWVGVVGGRVSGLWKPCLADGL